MRPWPPCLGPAVHPSGEELYPPHGDFHVDTASRGAAPGQASRAYVVVAKDGTANLMARRRGPWKVLARKGRRLSAMIPLVLTRGASGETCVAEEACSVSGQDAVSSSLLQAKNSLLKKIRVDEAVMMQHRSALFQMAEDSSLQGLFRRDGMGASVPCLLLSIAALVAMLIFATYYREVLRKHVQAFFPASLSGSQTEKKVPPETEETWELCPGLTVPSGCECSLLVPTRPRRGEPYSFVDNLGGAILMVADDPADQSSPHPRQMLSGGDGVLLAKVGRVESSFPSGMPAAVDFELVSAKGEVWAEMSYQPGAGADQQDKSTIKVKTGRQIDVVGSLRHCALNFTDEQGRLLATTELLREPGPGGRAPGTTYRLRIAPLTDVGLVACALTCLHTLLPS
mmetsp:Transcript_26482/g.61535  ORF Transcript_26482/g.61535 Transcript_26482/m.61535 type:complete len:398 (+) Transcript_26482:81-1274(+)